MDQVKKNKIVEWNGSAVWSATKIVVEITSNLLYNLTKRTNPEGWLSMENITNTLIIKNLR